ncbi:MAG: IgGFc-binding protein [Deltaproteobacteria bacterium]|nr:IgGFc-binding protein [Deltaproteobacteria bacterium]
MSACMLTAGCTANTAQNTCTGTPTPCDQIDNYPQCQATQGCSWAAHDGGHSEGGGGPCTEGSKQCEFGTNAWQTCQGGHWVTSVTCPLACDITLGCVECVPGSTACEGQDVVGCTAAGKKGGVVAHCQTSCSSGTCSDPCGQAEVNKSYLGCDYYPTVTMNTQLDETPGFSFAVAVAAPSSNSGAATITITGGGLTGPMTDTVAPGNLKTIKLPWVGTLKQDFVGLAQTEKSVLVANGAYHLISTQPITVYQFNALEYQVGAAYSYTNDASLLLPRHTWSDAEGKSSYIVMSRPTMVVSNGLSKSWSPGFFAVVGSQDGTQVSVKFTANTIAGASSNPQAYTPGSTGTFSLNAGTVLMIASGHNDACPVVTDPQCPANGSYCDQANGYDLTGTEITADKPVGVFGGHNCDFVPYNKWACDHLEEQLFPLTAWGKHYVGTRAVSTTDPNLWRVVSGEAANLIQFSPPINDKLTNTTIGQVTLDKGKWLEFITDQDFEAAGDTVFMLAGFMVGQNYTVCEPQSGAPGDPAMSLAVPVEQFRKSYTFHAPESYAQNYLTIIAKVGSTVLLDGNPITGFTAIGSGDYGANKLTIQGGTHTITTDGTDGFGIMVYGVGSYTSYMYPGGLDVKEIYVPG